MRVQVIWFVLLVMVLFEVTLARSHRYTRHSLHKAVIDICCVAGRKREVATEEVARETASTFLTSKLGRAKRGRLRGQCCSPPRHTCTQEVVNHTSLHEECVNEGCTVEEIDEVC